MKCLDDLIHALYIRNVSEGRKNSKFCPFQQITSIADKENDITEHVTPSFSTCITRANTIVHDHNDETKNTF